MFFNTEEEACQYICDELIDK